jgi:hypothetical protein
MGTRHHAGPARRRLGSLLTGAVLLLAPAALAAPASAASLSVNKPCYVFAQNRPIAMTVSGAGFAPGEQVSIASSKAWSAPPPVAAGATGAFTVALPLREPTFALPGQQALTLTATGLAGSVATTPVTVAPLGVSALPQHVPLSRRLTWYLSGFTPGKYIYVHYLHPKPVALAKLGRARGACGVLKTRARVYPGLHPRYREYNVQIDDARSYSKHSTPRLPATLNISVL